MAAISTSSDDPKDWTIVICGEMLGLKPLAIFVPNPRQWTVLDLQKEIKSKLGMPVVNQSLYCNDKMLPLQLPLADCEGMRNGVALLLCRKSYNVKVYRSDADITVPLEVPVHNWTITPFKEYIMHKVVGVAAKSYTLAIKDHILEDSDTVLVSCDPHIQDGCLMVLTLLKHQHRCAITSKTADAKEYAFLGPNFKFARDTLFFNLDDTVSHNHASSYAAKKPWTLNVQLLNGSQVSVQATGSALTPVVKLKKALRDMTSIPPYQQRLVIGKEIMEDYDDQGRLILLWSYPAVYDGATLCLLALSEGICIINGIPERIREEERQTRQRQVVSRDRYYRNGVHVAVTSNIEYKPYQWDRGVSAVDYEYSGIQDQNNIIMSMMGNVDKIFISNPSTCTIARLQTLLFSGLRCGRRAHKMYDASNINNVLNFDEQLNNTVCSVKWLRNGVKLIDKLPQANRF